MNEHYISLASNNSIDLYPTNNESAFTTQLSSPFSLKGGWELALLDIQFNAEIFNLRSPYNILSVSNSISEQTREIEIPPEQYESTIQLLDAINLSLRQSDIQDIFFALYNNKCTMSLGIDYALRMSEVLSDVLGFDKQFFFFNEHEDDPKQQFIRVEADTEVDVHKGLMYQIFCYCDIIEHQIISHISTQLLKIVPIYYVNAKHTKPYEIVSPQYLKLSTLDFDRITIHLKGSDGQYLSLGHKSVSPTVINLHLRKIDD